jgi:hypothetical protein
MKIGSEAEIYDNLDNMPHNKDDSGSLGFSLDRDNFLALQCSRSRPRPFDRDLLFRLWNGAG